MTVKQKVAGQKKPTNRQIVKMLEAEVRRHEDSVLRAVDHVLAQTSVADPDFSRNGPVLSVLLREAEKVQQARAALNMANGTNAAIAASAEDSDDD